MKATPRRQMQQRALAARLCGAGFRDPRALEVPPTSDVGASARRFSRHWPEGASGSQRTSPHMRKKCINGFQVGLCALIRAERGARKIGCGGRRAAGAARTRRFSAKRLAVSQHPVHQCTFFFCFCFRVCGRARGAFFFFLPAAVARARRARDPPLRDLPPPPLPRLLPRHAGPALPSDLRCGRAPGARPAPPPWRVRRAPHRLAPGTGPVHPRIQGTDRRDACHKISDRTSNFFALSSPSVLPRGSSRHFLALPFCLRFPRFPQWRLWPPLRRRSTRLAASRALRSLVVARCASRIAVAPGRPIRRRDTSDAFGGKAAGAVESARLRAPRRLTPDLLAALLPAQSLL